MSEISITPVDGETLALAYQSGQGVKIIILGGQYPEYAPGVRYVLRTVETLPHIRLVPDLADCLGDRPTDAQILGGAMVWTITPEERAAVETREADLAVRASVMQAHEAEYRRPTSELCPRCHTYCGGDCDA